MPGPQVAVKPAGAGRVLQFGAIYSMVSAWQDQFKNNPAVAAAVSDAVTKMAFPHYDTVDTSLSALDVNLLAALTGWCVVTADQQSKVFSGLFTA